MWKGWIVSTQTFRKLEQKDPKSELEEADVWHGLGMRWHAPCWSVSRKAGKDRKETYVWDAFCKTTNRFVEASELAKA